MEVFLDEDHFDEYQGQTRYNHLPIQMSIRHLLPDFLFIYFLLFGIIVSLLYGNLSLSQSIVEQMPCFHFFFLM